METKTAADIYSIEQIMGLHKFTIAEIRALGDLDDAETSGTDADIKRAKHALSAAHDAATAARVAAIQTELDRISAGGAA